uniref:YcxB family protein n=1 Tax=Prevotella sp. GTC17259 TaxID=3236795 RepID=A0AB33J5Q6_9BACT
MSKQELTYIAVGIIIPLVMLTIVIMTWRIVSTRRSVLPLPLGRNIDQTITCYYPTSLSKYLFYTFFNPKDLHFGTYYAFIGLLTITPINLIGPIIGAVIMLITLLYRLGRHTAHYIRLSPKMPAVELSAQGVRLTSTLDDATVCYMEDSWDAVDRVFLYRHYAKVMARKHTYYVFHDADDLDVRDKIAMHFMRHTDQPAYEAIGHPDSPSLLLSLLCLIAGPFLGLALYLIYRRDTPKSARAYFIVSLIIPTGAMLIAGISSIFT